MMNSQLLRGFFSCAISVAFLSGCSSFSMWTVQNSKEGDNKTAQFTVSEELIAVDFINAMKQIPSLKPSATTVQFFDEHTNDSITMAFKTEFEKSGYAVRWVSADNASNLFQYRIDDESAFDATGRSRLEIAVGNVELRRTYSGLQVGDVQPVTPLYVRGADASRVVLDDNIFDIALNNSGDKPNLLHVPDAVNPLSTLITKSPSIEPLTLPTVAQPSVQNVFELGRSNFEDALLHHGVVGEQILTFANDSLRLGERNKILIQALVSRYNSSTDLFSVVGCSMGPTNIKTGNAALALGRASRVREALLFAGVEQNHILDEGCWAGDSLGNSLPRRGVVLTLNRKI